MLAVSSMASLAVMATLVYGADDQRRQTPYRPTGAFDACEMGPHATSGKRKSPANRTETRKPRSVQRQRERERKNGKPLPACSRPNYGLVSQPASLPKNLANWKYDFMFSALATFFSFDFCSTQPNANLTPCRPSVPHQLPLGAWSGRGWVFALSRYAVFDGFNVRHVSVE